MTDDHSNELETIFMTDSEQRRMRADQLGSGVGYLFKYSRYYSGKDPEFEEDDVFRIVVPLGEPRQTQARPRVLPY